MPPTMMRLRLRLRILLCVRRAVRLEVRLAVRLAPLLAARLIDSPPAFSLCVAGNSEPIVSQMSIPRKAPSTSVPSKLSGPDIPRSASDEGTPLAHRETPSLNACCSQQVILTEGEKGETMKTRLRGLCLCLCVWLIAACATTAPPTISIPPTLTPEPTAAPTATLLASATSTDSTTDTPPATLTPQAIPSDPPPTVSQGETGESASQSTPSDIAAELHAFIDDLASRQEFSGAVLVAHEDRPLFAAAYGLADRALDLPNQVGTRFNLGSMDKMFTAIAILQLVEQGALSLDAKVADLLPDYPNRQVAYTVTVHQLLTHTAGLGDWSESPLFPDLHDQVRDVAGYLPLFVDIPLEFDPGARFRYSNSGYILLGLMLEKVTGQSYYDHVRENIFEPSGMTTTAAYELDAGEPDLALGYTKMAIDGSELPEITGYEFAMPMRGGPSGGGFSTVHDLLAFRNALLDHRLLSPETTELLLQGKVRLGERATYAYGFMDKIVADQRVVGHSGGAPGVCSFLDIYLDCGYTFIVLSNSDRDCLAIAGAIEQAMKP